MFEWVIIAYACIYISVVLLYLVKSMLYVRNKRWPRATLMRKRKEKCGQRPRKTNKAEGLNRKKKWKHKVLEYAKGIRVKRKMREAQSAWEKKVRCSMLCGNWIYCIASICGSYLFILLVIDYYPSFIIHISLPCNPQSPLDLIVPCILMGGELRTITSLWWGGMHWAKEWLKRP